MKVKSRADLEKVRRKGLSSLLPEVPRVTVGMASCGLASGAQEVYDALTREGQTQGVNLLIKRVGCAGECCEEPTVEVLVPRLPRLTYGAMNKDKAAELVSCLKEGRVMAGAFARDDGEDAALGDALRRDVEERLPDEIASVPRLAELPFYRKQLKVALRNSGAIDPADITEYIARGGYFALESALTGLNPEKVISEISVSGIRGRGGAGFSTGRKWEACRKAAGAPKYIIANGDEGDPGAYMDRNLMEGDPHSIIEGMVIAAYAIGASKGYIYVRGEYPLAVETLRVALEQARKYGFLGKDIFGSGFSFDVTLARGGGAFVCGESSALFASIEGRRGEPRAKYVHGVERGLWDKPTVLNNVETLANVPAIISRGAKWFSSMGTEGSKGTKVFSLVGKVNRVGLIEVPMGITLKEIVHDVGGGIPGGKKLKAVQTGGPSGGCIPASKLSLPVDFDALARVGSMMGSGGMIVMDESTCMVDVARYFVSFLEDESCGKCVPCREGLRRMRQVLDRITIGIGREEDLNLLDWMCRWISQGSLCGLGQTAPNPVLTTLTYFRDEYEAHIKSEKCPAGVCKELIYFSVESGKCVGCGGVSRRGNNR
jgi:NADH:ubiquinone oxidoreductase subunit F (NADH-binding)